MKPTYSEEENIRKILKNVIDPELMVNIIDLGLVYSISLDSRTKKIMLDLTLTSPNCPLGDVIIEHIKQVLFQHYLGFEIEINLVWEPIWDKEKISAEGIIALSQY